MAQQKIEDWSEIPEVATKNIREACEDIIHEIGGSFEYFEAKPGNTITMVWTGPMPKAEGKTLTISHRLAYRTFNFVNGTPNIIRGFMVKYKNFTKVQDIVLEDEVPAAATMQVGEFNAQKQQAYSLAKSILEPLGYMALPKEVYKQVNGVMDLIENYYATEFPESTSEERKDYVGILKEMLRTLKAQDKAIIAIEKAIHSV